MRLGSCDADLVCLTCKEEGEGRPFEGKYVGSLRSGSEPSIRVFLWSPLHDVSRAFTLAELVSVRADLSCSMAYLSVELFRPAQGCSMDPFPRVETSPWGRVVNMGCKDLDNTSVIPDASRSTCLVELLDGITSAATGREMYETGVSDKW